MNNTNNMRTLMEAVGNPLVIKGDSQLFTIDWITFKKVPNVSHTALATFEIAGEFEFTADGQGNLRHAASMSGPAEYDEIHDDVVCVITERATVTVESDGDEYYLEGIISMNASGDNDYGDVEIQLEEVGYTDNGAPTSPVAMLTALPAWLYKHAGSAADKLIDDYDFYDNY